MVALMLGNAHAAVATRDEKTDLVNIDFSKLTGDGTVTHVHFPDDTSLAEMFATVTLPGGVWSNHGAEPPLWVKCSDDPALAALLASHYGCPDKTTAKGGK